MFETERLIYVHCPKTGGIFIERVLRLEQRGRSLMGVHDPATQLSQEILQGRAVMATVRNPWDWYVSFYHYALETCGDHEREKGLLAYGQGETGFRAFLYGATHLAEVKIPMGVGVFWVMKGLGTRTIENAQKSGIGLCTLAYQTMYMSPRNAWLCTHLLDTAQLHDALWALARLDPERKALWAPQNVGCHLPPDALYDAEMASWVARADTFVLEVGGYTGPGTKASWLIRETAP